MDLVQTACVTSRVLLAEQSLGLYKPLLTAWWFGGQNSSYVAQVASILASTNVQAWHLASGWVSARRYNDWWLSDMQMLVCGPAWCTKMTVCLAKAVFTSRIGNGMQWKLRSLIPTNYYTAILQKQSMYQTSLFTQQLMCSQRGVLLQVPQNKKTDTLKKWKLSTFYTTVCSWY
jgi:hypothetical protein